MKKPRMERRAAPPFLKAGPGPLRLAARGFPPFPSAASSGMVFMRLAARFRFCSSVIGLCPCSRRWLEGETRSGTRGQEGEREEEEGGQEGAYLRYCWETLRGLGRARLWAGACWVKEMSKADWAETLDISDSVRCRGFRPSSTCW